MLLLIDFHNSARLVQSPPLLNNLCTSHCGHGHLALPAHNLIAFCLGLFMIMMMVMTIIMIKTSIFRRNFVMMRIFNRIVYTISKWRWNCIVTHCINKLIHLWLWHFDLHLPLDRVCLNRVNSTNGNGGVSRFRSRQCSTPGAGCSKFPAWSLHTFADLAKKKKRQTHFCVGEHSIGLSQNA